MQALRQDAKDPVQRRKRCSRERVVDRPEQRRRQHVQAQVEQLVRLERRQSRPGCHRGHPCAVRLTLQVRAQYHCRILCHAGHMGGRDGGGGEIRVAQRDQVVSLIQVRFGELLRL